MEYHNILIEINNNVAQITLNRPDALNALSDSLCAELIDLVPKLEVDSDVHVLVFTGAGRAFSAGGDIKKMIEVSDKYTLSQDRDRTLRTHALLKKIYHMKKPVIMAVNGIAAGAGCNLALSGDISIASEKASFIQAFVKVGLVPDWGGTFHLVRHIGLPKAKDMVFTGRKISAQEAEKMGMISHVVPDSHFVEFVSEYALNLSKGPAKALSLAKSLMNKTLNQSFESMLDYEGYAQLICRRTQDHKEGVKAFLEKRKPNFRGE